MKCYWLNFGYNESNNGFGLYLILNKLGHLSKEKKNKKISPKVKAGIINK